MWLPLMAKKGQESVGNFFKWLPTATWQWFLTNLVIFNSVFVTSRSPRGKKVRWQLVLFFLSLCFKSHEEDLATPQCSTKRTLLQVKIHCNNSLITHLVLENINVQKLC